MKVEKGDFAEVEYTGSFGDKVFDTSVESSGKDAGLTKGAYLPLLVAVGKRDVIKGFDDALIGMERGKEKAFDVEPEEGYGKRKEDLVRLVPLKVFKQNKVNPVPGMVLNLDNMPARIQSVSGGRVRVDFNHELAGKTLGFHVKVLKIYKKLDEKASAVVARFLPGSKVSVKDNAVKVAVGEKDLLKKEYLQNKAMVVSMLIEKAEAQGVEVIETFKKQ